MAADLCPVCGVAQQACTGGEGHGEKIIVSGVAQGTGPMRLPRQRAATGRTGYIGEEEGTVEVYEPGHPRIRMVPVDRLPVERKRRAAPADKRRKKGAKNKAR